MVSALFGDKYMTLSLEKYEDILRLVNSWVIRDVIPVGVSDEELVEYIIGKKEITLMRPHACVMAQDFVFVQMLLEDKHLKK